MLTKQIIIELLTQVVTAPSGDNKQPWRFEVKDSKEIVIFLKPEADHSLYNYKQLASYIAIGCLIENIIVVATHYKLNADVVVWSPGTEISPIARIVLSEAEVAEHELYSAVSVRATNRHPFKEGVLNPAVKNELLSLGSDFSGAKTVLVEESSVKEQFGKLVAVNEVILLENKTLHDLFFGDMVWTAEEERVRKEGLWFDTLALEGPPAFMFKRFKSWSFLSFFNKLGIAKVVAAQNAKIWGSGAAVGAVVIDGERVEDFITAGRVMERIWLAATKAGYALQPLSGVMFMARRIRMGDTETFNTEHTKLITETAEKIGEIFKVDSKAIKMVFRVGEGPVLKMKTSRKEPEVHFI